MRQTNKLAPIILLITLLMVGCSDRGSPLVPSQTNENLSFIHQVSASGHSNRYLWGLWNISVSEDHLNFTVTPDRSSVLHLNAVKMIEDTPCSDCLSIHDAEILSNGDLKVDVTLKHPYSSAPKLTTFDVRGILIADSDYTFQQSGRLTAWGDDQLRLLNADGYTSLFNPIEFPEDSPVPPALRYIPGKYKMGSDFTATLNPYLAYCEDQPRRMFSSGSIQTRTAVLSPPSGSLNFSYAVDVCWAYVSGEVTDPFTDFPPEANCLEAYKIMMETGAGLLTDAGSSVPILVEVWDHQGTDTISSVMIEAPELFAGEIGLSFSTVTGEESCLYQGILPNDLGAYIGQYPLLVKVSDTVADPNLGFIDAWQVFAVKVGPKDGWARTWGGESWDDATDMAVDDDGNIFVSGNFKGTVDFDPGPGVDEHTADPRGWYLSKFDPEGVFLWVRTWLPDMADSNNINALTIDHEGNVYIGGRFSYTMDFDPGPGVYELTPENGDPFLCMLDNEGTFQWALRWGISSDQMRITALTTDYLGYVYAGGMYYGQPGNYPIDFDPGPGEDYHDEDYRLFFLSKFDSSGQYQWVQIWGGGQSAYLLSLEAGSGQSLYVGGFYEGTADFDPGSGVDERHWGDDGDIFMSKFNTSGIYQWVRTWGCTDEYSRTFDIAVDSSGDILVAGSFQGYNIDFDPGEEEVLLSASNVDAYLSRFSSNGDFQWVKNWGESHIDNGESVAIDNDNNIYVTGSFYNTVDFDPGPGIEERTALGYDDAYLLKFYPNGDFNWVRIIAGISHEEGKYITVDNMGNAYVSGRFHGPVDFDPGPGVDMHSSVDKFDAFLSKIPPDGNW